MFCTFYLNKDLSKLKIIGLHYSRWSSCSLLENFLLLSADKGESSSYVHLFLKLCYLTRIKLPFQKLNSYCRAYSLRLPSRASEVESRTEGSRPRPRPRTQKKSEAKDSLSEDRHSRDQGQECSRPRPRTKHISASVLQKKKVFKNFFSGDLQFIDQLRIFDCGRPKPQITWNDVIKIFSNRKFLWDKDVVEWKIWNRCCLFARNQDFAKGEGLN